MAEEPPGSTQNPYVTAAKKLLMRMEKNEPLECCGVFDGITARIALEEAWEGFYVGGITACASRMAQADADSGAQTEFLDAVDNITELAWKVGTMIIADPETGMGDAIAVERMTKRFIKAGVAALVISDRAPAKGKDPAGHDMVMPDKDFLARVSAAHKARDSQDDILIIARSSGHGALGIDGSIKRLKDAEALGADIIWLTGVANKISPNDFALRVKNSKFAVAKSTSTPNSHHRLGRAALEQVALILWPDASIGTIVNWLGRDLLELYVNQKQSRGTRFETGNLYRLFGFYHWDKTKPEAERAAEEQLERTPVPSPRAAASPEAHARGAWASGPPGFGESEAGPSGSSRRGNGGHGDRSRGGRGKHVHWRDIP
ncbi:Pyruvate/Phosphoenolpyruvate kinase-like domain-containing protein [Aspergillus stella-maris]|uniref:Pyruvate/Phosphoenolpyruvate kinase-like domain-containing protein n=1 Tax=Aspergillus stella-maris TaxID=1810926 RepID=UPI003CCD2348